MSNCKSFSAFSAAARNHPATGLAGGALEETLAALFDYVGGGRNVFLHNKSPLVFCWSKTRLCI
jgi:hypothetical protein